MKHEVGLKYMKMIHLLSSLLFLEENRYNNKNVSTTKEVMWNFEALHITKLDTLQSSKKKVVIVSVFL
jgi:hypothetical protein